MKLLGNHKKGELFVVSGPSAAGKTSLVQKLCAEFPCVVKSISCTTRTPRQSEREGIDYYFLSEESFVAKVGRSEFLEYAKVFGNYYGTLKADVEKDLNRGCHVVLVIDTQGAFAVKKKLDTQLIFIAPPSPEVQKERLEQRQLDEKSIIEHRLACSESEMKDAMQYDYFIVNDDFDTAYATLRSIIIAQEHKIKK